MHAYDRVRTTEIHPDWVISQGIPRFAIHDTISSQRLAEYLDL